MLFITHDLPEALRLGDRIAIMRDGAIVQLGTPEDLVGSPADELRRELRARHPAHPRPDAALDHARRAARRGDGGPQLDVTTKVNDAVRGHRGERRPVRAVDDDRIVGVVDRVAVLKAMAGEGDVAVAASHDRGAAPALAPARAGAAAGPGRAAIVGAMAGRLLRAQGEFAVADSLVWHALRQARQRPELAAARAQSRRPEPGLRDPRRAPRVLERLVDRASPHASCG